MKIIYLLPELEAKNKLLANKKKNRTFPEKKMSNFNPWNTGWIV